MPSTIIAKTLMELGEVSIIKKETPEGVSIIRLLYLSVNLIQQQVLLVQPHLSQQMLSQEGSCVHFFHA